MVWRALHRDVESQFHAELRGSISEPLEVGERAQPRMNGRVPPLGAADAPRAAHVVLSGGERVVAALAEGVADGVDRCQVKHVEAHAADVVEPVGEVGERAVTARLAAPGAGKHLVPGAAAGRGPIDPHGPGVEPRLVAAVGVEIHQLPEPRGAGHVWFGAALESHCQRPDLGRDRRRSRMGGGGDEGRAHGEFGPQVFARRLTAAEIPQPGGEGIDAGGDEVVPEADAVGDERRPPAVVAVAGHGEHGPLTRVAVPHVEPAVQFLVAVADHVGLDHHLVATDSLHGEPAAVDLGGDTVDRAASPPGGGKIGMLFRHGCLRHGCLRHGTVDTARRSSR